MEQVTDMFDGRFNFSACSFMHKIYVFGGMIKSSNKIRSCFQLDTTNCTWQKVARINHVRCFAACTTFKGNIVISGGWGEDYRDKNTTESYDTFGNFWKQLPSMLSPKSGHSLVEVNNKLFAVGGIGVYRCEVLDEVVNKFVAVKTPIPPGIYTAIAVGETFFAFRINDSTGFDYKYDIQKEEWFKIWYDAKNLVYDFYCLKLPKVK